MAYDEERTLALFFTLGVSLETWSEVGILDRELALYDRLSPEFDRIILFTYGGESDSALLGNDHPTVEVIHRPIPGKILYSLVLPLVHRSVLREVDVVKTNQMLGSWAAVLTKLLIGCTLVVRTGYILSTFYNRRERYWPFRIAAVLAEYLAYWAADAIITSSEHGHEYVDRRYQPAARHVVIPNYIQTDVFRPLDIEPDRDLCFVGRLAPQKNLCSLLDALVDTGIDLTIIGEGRLESTLRRKAMSSGVDVEFLGRVPNQELPELINRHRVFVMPSHFEGMPKALLEAMACGVAVVATDVQGNNEVVENGVNGLLCDTDATSIRTAVTDLLSDPYRRRRLGAAARDHLVSKYSLEEVAEQERMLYESLRP